MHWLQRAVGLLILGTALAGAGLLWWSVSDTAHGRARPSDGLVLGVWHVLYDTEAPTVPTLAAAGGVALLFAAGVATLERRIANRARRSDDGTHLPLSPRHVMAETRGVFHGEVTLTVLVPAHNEAQGIAATLTSLTAQSRSPERIIVVADNCTDDTVAIARRCGAEVIESVDNVHKKAGALNQALARILPTQGENDLVMVMDADTVLVHLNPKQTDERVSPPSLGAEIATFEALVDRAAHFGEQVYGPNSPRTHRSPFDHKQVRFLRSLGALPFVEERTEEDRYTNLALAVDGKLQMELIPYGSPDFKTWLFPEKLLRPHFERLMTRSEEHTS